jgi:hypothetical protein
METPRGLNGRVTRLERYAPLGACRSCAERPIFNLGGAGAPCPECGRAPFVFTIDIDAASGREGDAA